MPRKPRFTLPGVPQHVIQRGNNREPCFLAEPDYRRYQEELQTTAEKHVCRIHAYVLMTNHVHLLVTPMQEHGIGEMMQALGRRYVYYINKIYRRTAKTRTREEFFLIFAADNIPAVLLHRPTLIFLTKSVRLD